MKINFSSLPKDHPIDPDLTSKKIEDWAINAFDPVKKGNKKIRKNFVFKTSEIEKIKDNTSTKYISFLFGSYSDNKVSYERTLIAIGIDSKGIYKYIETAYCAEKYDITFSNNGTFKKNKVLHVITEQDVKWYWPKNLYYGANSEDNLIKWLSYFKTNKAITHYPDKIGSKNLKRIEVFFHKSWFDNTNLLNFDELAVFPLVLMGINKTGSGIPVGNFITFLLVPVSSNNLQIPSTNFLISGIAYPPRWPNPLGKIKQEPNGPLISLPL